MRRKWCHLVKSSQKKKEGQIVLCWSLRFHLGAQLLISQHGIGLVVPNRLQISSLLAFLVVNTQ